MIIIKKLQNNKINLKILKIQIKFIKDMENKNC